jgi:hypothetical protein
LVELPVVESPAEILSEQTEGRQRRMVVRGISEEILDGWRSRPGVTRVSMRAASLEEIFAACVRGGNRDRSSDPTQRSHSTKSA